jgi:uridine kinase
MAATSGCVDLRLFVDTLEGRCMPKQVDETVKPFRIDTDCVMERFSVEVFANVRLKFDGEILQWHLGDWT